MKGVILGSGNVATHLSLALASLEGIEICQVYSPTEAHAEILAERLNCDFVTDPTQIRKDADVYLFALKDQALETVIRAVPANNGLWLHTSGSMPMQVFAGYTERYGVLYPLQTFSKSKEISFQGIPLFIECHREEDKNCLEELARRLSGKVCELSSEKRRSLHLAAVFACNFTNHIYALAEEILAKEGLSRDYLFPLIDETAAKVHELPAQEAQTGPAIRYDENIINKHLGMLADDPDVQTLYRLLSQSIHKKV